MHDEPLEDKIEEYLADLDRQNRDYLDVRIEWVRDDPNYGSLHIAGHGVSEEEVEEVIFEVPPEVEAKRSSDHPNRTLFWGRTSEGHWLFIVCADWIEDGKRYLLPITAFEPTEGRAYWEAQ